MLRCMAVLHFFVSFFFFPVRCALEAKVAGLVRTGQGSI